METAEEAEAAVTALNATDLMGKTMNVEKVYFEILSRYRVSYLIYRSGSSRTR
jgi:hypothetical protein